MQILVGSIGRAHGVRGEVAVDVRTDEPDHRFATGSVLDTDPATAGPLTVLGSRWHSGRLLLTLAGVADRTSAEALRGVRLVADSTTSPDSDDEDQYWDHQLVGLSAESASGEPLGEVEDVLHPPGGDLLVLRRGNGPELLVPFVRAIVPEVDLPAGRLVVDPPPGLLDLAEPG